MSEIVAIFWIKNSSVEPCTKFYCELWENSSTATAALVSIHSISFL